MAKVLNFFAFPSALAASNRAIVQPALEHAELAGLGYRFHDLRHTCVSRLVAAGVKLVQAVAGHASPLITLKRYSHLLDSRISEAADRIRSRPDSVKAYPAARHRAG